MQQRPTAVLLPSRMESAKNIHWCLLRLLTANLGLLELQMQVLHPKQRLVICVFRRGRMKITSKVNSD